MLQQFIEQQNMSKNGARRSNRYNHSVTRNFFFFFCENIEKLKSCKEYLLVQFVVPRPIMNARIPEYIGMIEV